MRAYLTGENSWDEIFIGWFAGETEKGLLSYKLNSVVRDQINIVLSIIVLLVSGDTNPRFKGLGHQKNLVSLNIIYLSL